MAVHAREIPIHFWKGGVGHGICGIQRLWGIAQLQAKRALNGEMVASVIGMVPQNATLGDLVSQMLWGQDVVDVGPLLGIAPSVVHRLVK